GLLAAQVVTQQVERDRVKPGLLAPPATVERAPPSEHALEGVGEEVLGEGAVAGPHDEEGDQGSGVLLVEALEILVAERTVPAQRAEQAGPDPRGSPAPHRQAVGLRGHRGPSLGRAEANGRGCRPASRRCRRRGPAAGEEPAAGPRARPSSRALPRAAREPAPPPRARRRPPPRRRPPEAW